MYTYQYLSKFYMNLSLFALCYIDIIDTYVICQNTKWAKWQPNVKFLEVQRVYIVYTVYYQEVTME